MLQGQLPDEPESCHENKSNPSISGEMIGQRWSSITRGGQQAYGRRRREEFCDPWRSQATEGVLKKPDHTTGGIAADPGHPVSGPPGETIGGEIGGKEARTLLNEVIFSTSEAEKFTSVRAGPVGSLVGDFIANRVGGSESDLPWIDSVDSAPASLFPAFVVAGRGAMGTSRDVMAGNHSRELWADSSSL
ncbi:hypothetical protein ASPNIDRAFT_41670 [Aspergillus niger ATCC 1015]|uniref:Uncharacterized protein n=1 Tax=Aspergillus niger (strain ATCC 1015 / CBS 113.46 / FGSC A1144 / LSHB Ac4 / NCTC 3858a / NRRL 328 / USDA 3528.7) TaxID=380704 RepID=G3XP72_ASPNA|nr:hypothetical protein ASPNIDRAFT_41670 [Aspergillus niger ATCC 1015]